jgi:acyl-CoA synthetase (AMP-forming)/AMP-acid ligase II
MIYDLLLTSASRFAERSALVEAGKTFTYGEVKELAGAAGGYLTDGTTGSVGTVALQLPNSIEYAVAIFALASRRVTMLLLDPALKAGEVASYCRRAGAGMLVGPPGQAWGTKTPPGPNTPSFDALLAALPRTPLPAHSQPAFGRSDADLFLFLSTGTSGTPKIVRRTGAQTAAAVEAFKAAFNYSEHDKVLVSLPFSHSFGLINAVVSSLASGASVHMSPFSPRRTAELIERDRITVFPATPFMFRMLVETDMARAPDFSSLRLAVATGSPLAPVVGRRFREKFGVSIVQAYGATETGPVAFGLPTELGDAAGCVGRPYAGVSVEVRDSRGRAVAPGAEGEIWVRSPACSGGYFDDAMANAATFVAGYVRTGDVGRLDASGHLFVLGRNKPMLNVAGKKVAPAEVEACLRSHPAVADVLVVGLTAAGGGERIQAFVVPAAPVTALELQAFCGQRLADFKVPRQVVFVASLSSGAMGKPRASAPEPM